MKNEPNCILCGRPITRRNDSVEHIIPNGIGGRLKRRRILCSSCNAYAGREWDAHLCEQLNLFSLLLGITRERGVTPPQEVQTATGTRLLLHPDRMTPATPRQKHVSDAQGNTRIEIAARSEQEARAMLRQAKRRFPGLDVDAALSNINSTWERLDSPLQMQPELGGANSGRSIVKTAICFAAIAGADAARCRPALEYLLNDREVHSGEVTADWPARARPDLGDSSSEPPFGFFYERDLVRHRPEQILHRVAVSSRNCGGQLLAYVEYFGAWRCIVRLANQYEGDVHSAHFVDPVTGKMTTGEVDLVLSRSEVQACFGYEKIPPGSMEQAMEPLMRATMRWRPNVPRWGTIARMGGPLDDKTLTPQMRAAIQRLVFTQSTALVRLHSQWWVASNDAADAGQWMHVSNPGEGEGAPAFTTATVAGLVRRGVLKFKGPKRRAWWPPYSASHFRAEFIY
jgi:hypothetical protein